MVSLAGPHPYSNVSGGRIGIYEGRSLLGEPTQNGAAASLGRTSQWNAPPGLGAGDKTGIVPYVGPNPWPEVPPQVSPSPVPAGRPAPKPRSVQSPPVGAPQPFPSPRPLPDPGILPNLAPDAFPPGADVPPIAPLPWRMIPGRRWSPWPQGWQGGNGDPAPQVPDVQPDRLPDPIVVGSPAPVAPPTFAPPPPGTKEKKFKANRSVAVLFQIASAVTETSDFVDALYWALPRRDQKKFELAYVRRHDGRGPRLQDRALYVYRHLDEVDGSKFLHNLVVNEVQDRVIGRLSRSAQMAFQRAMEDVGFQRPVGLQFGPAL